jgi:hypothetical protein
LYPETTKKPSVPKAGVESYVRLHEPFVVPCGILLPLDGGTARLSKQDMEMVMRKVQGSRENKSKVVNKWPWGQAKMQREAMEYKGRIYGSRSVGGVLNDRWTENSLGSLCLDDEYGLLSDRFVRKPAGDVDENGLWRTLKFIIGLPIFVVATLLSWLEWLAYTVVIGIPSFILRTIFLLVTWLVRAVLFVVSGIIILSVAVLCAKVLIACTVFMVELSLNFHKDYIACLNYGLCR